MQLADFFPPAHFLLAVLQVACYKQKLELTVYQFSDISWGLISCKLRINWTSLVAAKLTAHLFVRRPLVLEVREEV